ncbi:MAG: assimilatory sulfite reductase (NADPH) flavoprotein subunit [Pseudomonadota bacterium]
MSSLPVSAPPLSVEQTTTLHSVVDELSPPQLQWVSGYVAGLAAANHSVTADSAPPLPTALPEQKLTILFGSQTGNGEALAERLAADVKAAGFAVNLQNLADYKPASLKREKFVAFVVSTHGEGDPPDDAELFREFLLADKAPKLDGLNFSVLALGDSSYVNFCETGREFDRRLAELGATRFHDLVECDLDYDEPAAGWSAGVTSALPELLEQGPPAAAPRLRAVESALSSAYDRNNPFAAEVLVNQKITGGSSSKDVRHVELSLEGSGLKYEPGDALAVVVNNPPQLVAEVLEVLGIAEPVTVTLDGQEVDLRSALTSELEITAVNLGFLRGWSELADDAVLRELLAPESKTALSEFVDNHQVIDVLRRHPAAIEPQAFVELLRKLAPRSYSIASSLAANPDEVHLTVAAVRYEAHGTEHWGAGSTYLADRLAEGDSAKVFVERNSRFRLPAPTVPVIMIGPGTGVAPFRAFVEERVATDAPGDNWLLFGDRNFDSDFLYQLEWQRHLKQGHLARLDVAFSRDQNRKVYVQDRIRENAAEFGRWLDAGAAIYVCGDAKRMAGDVHDAIVDVIAQHNNIDRDAAEQRLKELRQAGRYQRDVY